MKTFVALKYLYENSFYKNHKFQLGEKMTIILLIMLRFTFKNSFNEKVSLKTSASAYAVCCKIGLLLKPGPRLWTPTQGNLDPEKIGPGKPWTLKNLDLEKPARLEKCGKQLDAVKRLKDHIV